MSTPTDSEASESKTRPHACVALYAGVNDRVDPVDMIPVRFVLNPGTTTTEGTPA